MENKKLVLEIKKTSHDIKKYVDVLVRLDPNLSFTGIEGMFINFFGAKEDNHEIVTAGSVIDSFHINKASTSVILSNLEKKGLVEQMPNPQDKRSKIIRLTEAGNSCKEEYRRLFANVDDELSSALSKDEMKMFFDLLERIQLKAGELRRKLESEAE